jgi:hypothetical protein
MDLNNKNIIAKPNSFNKNFEEKIKLRVSDRFDLSVIGTINLAEAEKIAKEEVLFVTEKDIMASLEDFELIPVKLREKFNNEIAEVANIEEDVTSNTTKKAIDRTDIENTSSLESTINFISSSESVLTNKSSEKIAEKAAVIPDSLTIDSAKDIDDIELLFDEKIDFISDDKIIILEPQVEPENIKTVIHKSDTKEDFEYSNKSDDFKIDGDISEIIRIIDDDYNFVVNKENASIGIEVGGYNELKPLDITNEIIILDDKEKLNLLTSEFPGKRDNLVKLLSYLDGLFEKLPEDVIRKFAESEYFDLYSKILKDMGK